MVRIRILSDLHLERGTFQKSMIDADLVVLAGDIWTKGRVVPWTNAEEFFNCPVALIPGNHEFYEMKIDTAVAKMKAVGAAKRVAVLDNDELVIDDLRILGATLWTDFKLWAGDDIVAVKRDADFCVGTKYTDRLADFWSIRVAKDDFRRFQPEDAVMLHEESVAWLDAKLAEPFDGETMVVTHHAPSLHCVPEMWRADRFTCAYASRLDWLIEKYQPSAWIWGHIHDPVEPFRMGRTLMVSNPRGYAPDHLNPRFDPNMVIEIGKFTREALDNAPSSRLLGPWRP